MAMKDKNGNFNADLLDYVRRGSVELMQSLLRNDDPELIDLDGKTLLHYAAESNNVSMTRHFINNNHNVDIVDNHGNSPLMLAVDQGSYDAAKLLVAAGANIYLCRDDAASILSKPNFEKGPPMWYKYEEFVDIILRQVRKDCCNDEQLLLTRLRHFGCSLVQVISLQDANVTRLMLKNGYSVDERNMMSGDAALHEAVQLGDYENVKVLLEFGASVDALNECGLPPILTLYNGLSNSQADNEVRVKIIQILIEHGALSTQLSDDDNLMTPTHYIFQYGNLEAINTLMQHDVEYNSFDALSCLVSNIYDDALEVLRGKSFDVNAYHIDTDGDRYSLLSRAICFGRVSKVRFLLEHGANPNAVDSEGQTPLINAFTGFDPELEKNLVAIVRLLLQYGADAQHFMTYEDQEQQTVFDQENNTDEVLESIIAHLALIESCGVTISELIRGEIDSRDTCKKHFQICKKQIEEMMETMVNGSVTLHKLLTESHLKITRYARDPEFSLKFKVTMKIKRFLNPYYSIQLHERVDKAIHEVKLKEEAAVILNEIFPCRFRNYHVVFSEILEYLTYDDLKNICKVYDL